MFALLTVFIELQLFRLTDPIVLLHAAFEFLQARVNSCDVGDAECSDLPVAKNTQLVQGMVEYLVNAHDLLPIGQRT
jgi:hypothetical protein